MQPAGKPGQAPTRSLDSALIWYGYMVPAKTPRPIVEKLYKEIAAIANSPEVRQTFVSQGNDVVANTPEEVAKVIKAEAEKWGAIGKRLGVTMDGTRSSFIVPCSSFRVFPCV